MLVLTRKAQERILIGDDIVVTVIRIQGKGVRIGIEAPRSVTVRRAELVDLSEDGPRAVEWSAAGHAAVGAGATVRTAPLQATDETRCESDFTWML